MNRQKRSTGPVKGRKDFLFVQEESSELLWLFRFLPFALLFILC